MNTYVCHLCMIIVTVYSYCSLLFIDDRRCPSMFDVRQCSTSVVFCHFEYYFIVIVLYLVQIL